MQRILSSQLPAHIGETVRVAGWIHRRRLLKSVAFLILRDAAGLTQIVVTDAATRAQLEALPEETMVAVIGTVTAEPEAPGGVEITEPAIEPLTDPAEPPPFDLYRPDLKVSLPTMLDHAPVALRHPRLAADAPDRRGRRRPVSGPRSTSGRSSKSTPRRSWVRRPRAARTSSSSTTSAARPTWRSRRSSTSRSWSASSSGSTRSARSSAPSRATPPATSRRTPRSTPSSGSSTTIAT